MTNPKLLLLADWFAPGYRAGGPITSCVNLCEGLTPDFSIFVLTGDRDLGASSPYAGVQPGRWQRFNLNTKVYYCPPEKQNYRNIRQIIQEIAPDIVYINSMFSRVFAIHPLLMLLTGQIQAKAVLAPRGMLRASALQFKALKKQFFLKLFNILKLPEKLIFHAADAEETKSIISALDKKSKGIKIKEIPNFPALPVAEEDIDVNVAVRGSFLFLGRIHPVKGLLTALQALHSIENTPVRFSIAGPLEDKRYWDRCQQKIASLPLNIRVDYLGEQPPAQVKELLACHAFLLLPTQGENFGHAIFEAFAAARPVIISDQTPWRGLREKGIGWDVSISRPAPLREALRAALELDDEEYRRMCRAAHQFATDFIENSRLKERYLELFSISTPISE